VTDAGTEGIAELAVLAGLLADARTTYDATAKPVPDPESEAAAELEQRDPTDPPHVAVERLIRLCELWLLIASDQLYGLGVMLRDGRTVYSPFPLLRSVVEHSTAVVRLLDDQVPARVRAARAGLAEIRGAEDTYKALSHLFGGEHGEAKRAKANAKRLKAEIGAEFGTLDLRDPRTLEGEQDAAPTTPILLYQERFGEGRQWEGIYDLLCATANHPSITAYAYLRPDGAHISVEHLRQLLSSGLAAYIRAVGGFATFMGWPTEALDEYVDRVNAAIKPPHGDDSSTQAHPSLAEPEPHRLIDGLVQRRA
jgi:hypothetical protein